MSNPTIAILGKPNVGKSTLFNRLVGQRQSIVSHEAGVTRDRIYGHFDWLGREFNLIDTGGYILNSNDIIENQVKIQAEIAWPIVVDWHQPLCARPLLWHAVWHAPLRDLQS